MTVYFAFAKGRLNTSLAQLGVVTCMALINYIFINSLILDTEGDLEFIDVLHFNSHKLIESIIFQSAGKWDDDAN